MSKNKGVKTSIVAIAQGIIIFGCLGAMIMDKMEFDEVKNVIAVTTPVAVMMIGWFSKDSNQSHTKP